MTDKSVWDKEVPVPASLIAYVDAGVVAKLPPGTTPTGIVPSGASYWARTAKINAVDADGNETAFFMKVHQGEHGRNMVSNEYHSMLILYEAVPEMVAEPLAWGSYEDDPDAYFFLTRYCEMSDDIPPVDEFPELIAKMHMQHTSPTGEFGFPLVTYGGRNPQFFPMSKTWEECFTKGMEMVFDQEEQTQGPDEELAVLRKGFFELIIPRLLRPLESEGRTLTPRLVHGDLWDGNTSVDVNTGQPMIFDPTPLYAHNEYELAPWWCSRHKMTDAYINEYIQYFQMTEPVEEFHDRGAIYNLRFDMHSSSLYPGNIRFRNLAKETMRRLIEKYPRGYEGYLADKGIDAQAINAANFNRNAEIDVQAVDPQAIHAPVITTQAINAVSFNKNAGIEATVLPESTDLPEAPVAATGAPVTEVTVEPTQEK